MEKKKKFSKFLILTCVWVWEIGLSYVETFRKKFWPDIYLLDRLKYFFLKKKNPQILLGRVLKKFPLPKKIKFLILTRQVWEIGVSDVETFPKKI